MLKYLGTELEKATLIEPAAFVALEGAQAWHICHNPATENSIYQREHITSNSYLGKNSCEETLESSAANRDPVFFDPWIRVGKNPDPE